MNRSTATLAALAASTVAVASPAIAGKPLDRAVENAIACRTIATAEERLACFDSAADSLAGAKGESARQAASAKENKARKERDSFGLTSATATTGGGEPASGTDFDEFGVEDVAALRRAREEERVNEITAESVSIQYLHGGRVTLTLNNGQVWRQLDSDSTYLPGARKGRTYSVTLKRAAMGGYRARIEELDKSIRVRRVK